MAKTRHGRALGINRSRWETEEERRRHIVFNRMAQKLTTHLQQWSISS
jgi:hypothetical protein